MHHRAKYSLGGQNTNLKDINLAVIQWWKKTAKNLVLFYFPINKTHKSFAATPFETHTNFSTNISFSFLELQNLKGAMLKSIKITNHKSAK